MEFIFIIIILILSVVIHEVSHGYAALYLGDPTAKYAGRLTLNPIKHLDLVGSFIVPAVLFLLPTSAIVGWAKPVPINPYNLRNQQYGEAIVAAAGPLSNVVVAAVFGVVVRVTSGAGLLSAELVPLFGLVILINLVLAVFNMIPIPPLDGSKILFTFLPASLQEFRMMFERNIFIVLIIILLFAQPVFYVIFTVVSWIFLVLTGDASILNETAQFLSGQ